MIVEVSVLHPDEVALHIEVGNLKPVGSRPVLPRGEAAPAHHTFVEPSLLEEELSRLVAQPRMLEESQVAAGIEGRRIPNLSRIFQASVTGIAVVTGAFAAITYIARAFATSTNSTGTSRVGALRRSPRAFRVYILRIDPGGLTSLDVDSEAVGEPVARHEEVHVLLFHHEVDGSERLLHADETSARVLASVKGEAGVVIVVEGAERLVMDVDLHPQLLGDLLDGEVAKLFKFIFFHVVFF